MATIPAELQALFGLLATPETPELGPGPRVEVQSVAELNQNFDRIVARSNLPPVRQELLRCVVLLWHDHHDEAHAICQEIETPDGSWLHGILHRREPDFGNARYWFHRVGRHPGFSMLAESVNLFLAKSAVQQPTEKLLPRGQWDPFAFVAECEQATGPTGSSAHRECLREVQKFEFEVLLEYFWNGGAALD